MENTDEDREDSLDCRRKFSFEMEILHCNLTFGQYFVELRKALKCHNLKKQNESVVTALRRERLALTNLGYIPDYLTQDRIEGRFRQHYEREDHSEAAVSLRKMVTFVT